MAQMAGVPARCRMHASLRLDVPFHVCRFAVGNRATMPGRLYEGLVICAAAVMEPRGYNAAFSPFP